MGDSVLKRQEEMNVQASLKISKRTAWFIICFFAGFIIFTILTNSLSPVLPLAMEDLSMNLTVANLAFSITYILMAISLFAAPVLHRKWGTKVLFAVCVVLCIAGAALNFHVNSIFVLLVSRILMGAGLGPMFNITGNVIMAYVPAKRQPTLNGLFGATPYIGNCVALLVAIPITNAWSGDWRMSSVIWGVVLALVLVLWLIIAYKKNQEPQMNTDEIEKNLLAIVWKHKLVKYMVYLYTLDMIVFSFICTTVPTYLNFEFGTPLDIASIYASAFPVLGAAACLTAGVIIANTGTRRPSLIISPICKIVGIVLMVLPITWLRVLGIGILGAGGALWMPAFYCIPMDTPGFDEKMVGAAIGLASAIAFVVACIAPVIGGFLATVIGFKLTFLIWAVPAIIALIISIKMPETGPGKTLTQK